MFLARKHTGAAYSEIGRFFGGRNHSTVISAEKKVLGWIKDEARNALLAGFETMGDILNSPGTDARGLIRRPVTPSRTSPSRSPPAPQPPSVALRG